MIQNLWNDSESIRTLCEKENFKYFGIMAPSEKKKNLKEKNKKEYFWITKKLLKTKLIKVINTCEDLIPKIDK